MDLLLFKVLFQNITVASFVLFLFLFCSVCLFSPSYLAQDQNGSTKSRYSQTSLSQSTSSNSSVVTPRDIISLACPDSAPVPPPSGTCPKHLTSRCPRGILIRCLNHLSWLPLMWRSSGYTLSTSQMTELYL